jgi:hypothetical protein
MSFFVDLIFEAQPKGFSFQTLDQMYAKNYRSVDAENYVSQYFKPDTFMGQGSSRLVYRLDSKKVLKLAHDQKKDIGAGIEQNQLEAKISSQFPNVLSKVFRIHPKGYYLVSELVRPVKNWDEITNYFGIDIKNILVGESLPDKIKANIKQIISDGLVEKKINYFTFSSLELEIMTFIDNKSFLTHYLEDWLRNRKMTVNSEIVNKIQYELNELIHFERTGESRGTKQLMKTIQGKQIVEISKILSYGDLLELDHWGKTADGKIVLLDYGFDENIAKQYY